MKSSDTVLILNAARFTCLCFVCFCGVGAMKAKTSGIRSLLAVSSWESVSGGPPLLRRTLWYMSLLWSKYKPILGRLAFTNPIVKKWLPLE